MSGGRRRARADDDGVDDDGSDDGEEHRSLIELPSSSGDVARRGARPRPPALALQALDGGDDASARSRRAALLLLAFVAVLAGVYHLGLQGGKRQEATREGGGGLSAQEAGDAADLAPSSDARPAGKKKGSLTLDRIRATREECNKIINLLEGYYYGKDQAVRMLVNSFVDPWDFDASETDPEKRLRANKLVDTMARALVTDDQDTFLMGGIGSSVMAGHDNCLYDSYESQLERLLRPVWKAAGMDFVFQNAGIGGGCGDSHLNQHFCVGRNISPDVDIVHYEWTYFEHGGGHEAHEDLVRWTQLLPKRPPVHIYNTGLSASHQERELVQYYADYGFNAFYMKLGFINGGHDYESEKKRKDRPLDRFGPGMMGDGYHNTTRYGEEETDHARKASLGVVMRNWHPGPLGFQLTSDAFGFVYTKATLKALELIEEDITNGKDPRDTWEARRRPRLSKGELPDPMFCNWEYCTVDRPPRCMNYESPTYGDWGAVVEDPNSETNPYRGEVQNWTIWKEPQDDVWKAIGKQDAAVFRNREDKDKCYHLGRCGGIAGEFEDGAVVFHLPEMKVGLVVICGCCYKRIGETMFINNEGVEISYNGIVIPRQEWDLWPNPKCVRVRKRFPEVEGGLSEKPSGQNYLAVRPLESMKGKGDIKISHVITL